MSAQLHIYVTCLIVLLDCSCIITLPLHLLYLKESHRWAVYKADTVTAFFEPIVYKMWVPQHLTTL
jgi:hypothetical protein